MTAQKLVDAHILLKISGGRYKPDDIFLLVEGITDKEFVERLNIKKVQCIAIGTILEADCALKGNKEKPNNKKVILDVIKGKTGQNCYGLVDKDFDSERRIQEYHKNVLVTPTHDLETLLLSTDKKIFEAPEMIKESFDIALYVAYLVGCVDKYLLNNGYRYRKLQNDDLEKIITTPVKKLTEITDLTELVNFDNLIDLSIDESDKTGIRRKIKQEHILDVEIDDIGEKELYETANGHDIANIIRLLCKDCISDFIKGHNHFRSTKLDRNIEFAIIGKYDLSMFKICKLYKEMSKKGLKPTNIF